jgi:hypothetical protein
MSAAKPAPSKKQAAAKLPGKSKSERAGLIAGVSRVERRLRDSKISKQVGASSSVFLTGVIEEVIESVLLRAGKEAQAGKKKRINVVHIVTAARSDPDTARLLAGFGFGSALNIPKHAPQLMSEDEKKAAKKKKSGGAEAGA